MTKENQQHQHRPKIIALAICAVVISLGYINDPPNGYTGAPEEGICSECHSTNGSMQNGSIILNGFPLTINTEQTYTLTITVTNPNGIADYAGFQAVVLDDNNENSGILFNPSTGSKLDTTGSRVYHEHSEPKVFGPGNAVSWTVNWTAPTGSGLLSFYAAANIANGNGEATGDRIVSTSKSGTLISPLQAEIVSVTHVSCASGTDGAMSVQANFGQPPYSYQWSNGETGQHLTNLNAGNYSVTVTDTGTSTATASAVITEPPPLETASESIQHVSCHGGHNGIISLTIDGGSPPYNNMPGDVLIFDSLSAGDYLISVTDANGCLLVMEYTILQPESLLIEATQIVMPACAAQATGTIAIEGSGGTGDLSYLWSTGVSGTTLMGVSAGVYSVTITDQNNCTATETFVLNEPQPLTIDLLDLMHVSCTGASDAIIIVEGNGGTGQFSYDWSNGGTGPDLQGLGSGIYIVTVTDANNCSTTGNYTITEPPSLALELQLVTEIFCFGESTGALWIDATGGTPGYNYIWSTGESSQSVTGLSAGEYSVTVTDMNGCTGSDAMLLQEPSQLLPNASATGVSAPDSMDGTAMSVPSGGVSGYSFLWSTGATTAMISDLSIGAYTVTVTDGYVCTATQSVAVTGANCTLMINTTSTDALCFGLASGTAEATVTGATGPIEILWSNGATTLAIADLEAGLYTATVTDSTGCIAVTDIAIEQPLILSSVCIATDETMNGAQDGSISCIVSGGTMPYSYLWSSGDTTDTITGLTPGGYSLTITDSNGCMHLDTAFVNPFTCTLHISISAEDALCFGENSGSASVVISGGASPYEVRWSNGDEGLHADSLGAGVYSITVTDADSCGSVLPFRIDHPDPIVVTVDTVLPAMQATGGAIQISIVGGTPPFVTIWTHNGDLISTNEDIAGLAPGEYQLAIHDAHDCSLAIDTFTVSMTTAALDIKGGIAITLSPNPAGTYLLLDIRGMQRGWRGMIYNAEGRLVQTFETNGQGAGQMIRIETEALRAGLYYISISGVSGQRTIPFMKS